MKKKLILFLSMICMCSCLAGCEKTNDTIEIYNRSGFVFDNVTIPIKTGYFYDNYEKFTVDDHTVGVTVYFTNSDGEW